MMRDSIKLSEFVGYTSYLHRDSNSNIPSAMEQFPTDSEGIAKSTNPDRATLKKTLKAMHGSDKPVTLRARQGVREMIRYPQFKNLTGEYDVADEDGNTIYAKAKVQEGRIVSLELLKRRFPHITPVRILNALLDTIVREADRINSYLVIAIRSDLTLKRFLERYGFADIGHGKMRRRPGAIRPVDPHWAPGL